MKKFIFVMAAMAAMVLSSCGKDGDGDGTNNSLVGTWDLISYTRDGKTYQTDECAKKNQITFYADGRYESHYYRNENGECKYDLYNRNYKVSGNTISFFNNGNKEIDWSYSIKDNLLTINFYAHKFKTNETEVFRRRGSSDNGNGGNNASGDLAGTWKIKLMTYQGQTIDATSLECWNKSVVSISGNKVSFQLYYKDQNDGPCKTENSGNNNITYTKSGNTYTFLVNGQPTDEIYMSDNNQTLNIRQTENGKVAILSFKR
ncbi:lipocalin family protein [Capnocytophaga gingivalis]|jgi:hypothetical protein|uniref:lipocalin family protein n=1 Tax=Capnocytophaga gingivalis TaxID=1017 RepID=UPI0028D7C734|nr:lipocalin family protein [Capnocytophaga gingivalis]